MTDAKHLRITFAPYAQIVTQGTNLRVSTHVTTKRFGANASRFSGKVLPNNLKISAQLKGNFHALCLKFPINSSLV
jgi:hypothetical protein